MSLGGILMQADVYVPKNYNITKGCGVIDSNSRIISTDENLHRFLGMKSERTLLTSLIDTENAESLKQQLISEFESICFMTKILRVDGQQRDVLLRITNKGDKDTFEFSVMDIINADLKLSSLKQNNLRYRKLLEMQKVIFFEYNPKEKMFRVYFLENTREVTLKVYSTEEMLSSEFIKKVTDQEKVKVKEFVRSIINGDMYFEYRFSGNFESGLLEGAEAVSMVGHSVYTGINDFFILGVIRPTDVKEVEYLFNSSKIDITTGLLNKKAILDLGKRYLESKIYKQLFFAMIDIDNFKLVNDNYGHAMGDKVIVDIANILKTVVGDRGAAGRFGGDEYFLVMYDLGSEGDLRSVLGMISQEVGALYSTVFEGFSLSCSMGISEYPRNGDDFDLLFKKADKGLYLAKKKGKRRYIIYKEEMHGEIDPAESIEDNYFTKKNTEKIASDIALYNLINSCIQNLFVEGENAVEFTMQSVLDIYNLSGITIYMGEGMKVFKRWGNYSKPMEDASYMYTKEGVNRFNSKNIFLENNVKSNGFYVPVIHDKLVEHNIYSTIQCIMGSPEDIKGIVTFDVEEMIRSWNEEDANYFGILAQILCKIYNQ